MLKPEPVHLPERWKLNKLKADEEPTKYEQYVLDTLSNLFADAPLAVIFLVGSTLEGLLAEIALAHATTFASSSAAPKAKGASKPLDQWTLSELINVAHSLGVLGEDVAKHADQVRNFRNYIHPRQQLKEGFDPRIETARIAQQVLRAALADLRAFADRTASA